MSSKFSLADESNEYRITLGGHSGDLQDAFNMTGNRTSGDPFSTYDRNNYLRYKDYNFNTQCFKAQTRVVLVD